MTIRLLDEETINQIAAGEVVEDPASVVKELVENSLDAGATHLLIEMAGGGLQRIAVHDDGKGMDREDLSLCLKRHATSKIRRVEDLEEIHSMGFRGEALAAIAAVSQFVISSIVQGEEIGHRFVAEGGKIQEEEKVVRRGGTSVEVLHLFYNVPARRKFQRSPEASQAEIVKIVLQLALSHPSVGFELFSEEKGRILLSLGGKKGKEAIRERVCDLLGVSFLEGAIVVEEKRGEKELFGWISPPHTVRYNRSGQYLFVNRRTLFSKEISTAVYDAYGNRIEKNRHPLYLLYLTLPGRSLDVNVHPQKREVRFVGEEKVGVFVKEALSQALCGRKGDSVLPNASRSFPFAFLEETGKEWGSGFVQREERTPLLQLEQEEMVFPSSPFGIFGSLLFIDAKGWKERLSLEEEGGILLVDLHRASARIFYDRVLAKRRELQTLLLPISLEVSVGEGELLLLYGEKMKEVGIDLRPFGPTTFLVEALDPAIEEGALPSLIFELAEIFHTFTREGQREKEREKKIASLLSSFVRKEKNGYTFEEGEKVWEEVVKSSSFLFCPRGKRIIRHLKEDEIKRLFY